MIMPAAIPSGGTRAVMLSVCANTPPIFEQAATQPVARPRTFSG
jgi:hypothetical protein